MSDEIKSEKENCICGPKEGLADLLYKYIGETVTIFTASGGESGSGFTGVIMTVNNCFVKLLTQIGPPPGCSLGNACNGFNVGPGKCAHGGCGISHGFSSGRPMPGGILPASYNGAIAAGGWDAVPVYTVGSVTDIPIDRIVSFVHDTV